MDRLCAILSQLFVQGSCVFAKCSRLLCRKRFAQCMMGWIQVTAISFYVATPATAVDRGIVLKERALNHANRKMKVNS